MADEPEKPPRKPPYNYSALVAEIPSIRANIERIREGLEKEQKRLEEYLELIKRHEEYRAWEVRQRKNA